MNIQEEDFDDRGAPDDEEGGGGEQTTALTFRTPGHDSLAKIETQGEALAAAAAREMEVRYALARRFPRDISLVEKSLLADCSRPGFAEKARYARPVGKKKNESTGKWEEAFAEGFSIRFAESAQRALTNMDSAAFVIYEDAEKARLRCVVTDMETNSSWKLDVDVPKTVERKKLKKGQKAIGTRENTYGDPVYIVVATSEEFRVKTGAEISKALRTLILRLVPADVKEACEAQIKATLSDEFRKSAAKVVAKLTAGFAALRPSVSAADIGAFLGHPVEQLTEADYLELRAIYMGIAEGFTTWATLLAEKRGDVETSEGEKSTVEKLKAELAARAAKKQGAAAQGSPAKQEQPSGAKQEPPKQEEGAPKNGSQGSAGSEEREPGADG